MKLDEWTLDNWAATVSAIGGDLNGDGEVDLMDANMIVAYYNERIDTFPVEHLR